jgi:hypothetical protein
MKKLKWMSVAALGLTLVACGKSITIHPKNGATATVQTLSGPMQVTGAEKVSNRATNEFVLSFNISHAGRSISLTTFASPSTAQNGYNTQNYGNDYYAVRSACADMSCNQFVALFNYGTFGSTAVQMAVLYQALEDGEATQLDYQTSTAYNSIYDAFPSFGLTVPAAN